MNNKLFITLAAITTIGIITKVIEIFSIKNNLTFTMIKPDAAREKTDTIRTLFGTNITANAVHGSDSWQTARQEINQFFPALAANSKEKINSKKNEEQQYA